MEAIQSFSPNTIQWRRALHRFHGCLKLRIVIGLALGEYVEVWIIADLLAFNVLGSFQKTCAQATLATLRSRLVPNASARPNEARKTTPAKPD